MANGCLHVSLTSPHTVQLARDFVRSHLDEHPDTEAAVLLTSELVTNSLVHVGGPVDVEVRSDAEGIWVGVSDGSPGPPVLHPSQPDADRGRGLQIVNAFSDDWGTKPSDGGKTVWFTLPVVE